MTKYAIPSNGKISASLATIFLVSLWWIAGVIILLLSPKTPLDLIQDVELWLKALSASVFGGLLWVLLEWQIRQVLNIIRPEG